VTDSEHEARRLVFARLFERSIFYLCASFSAAASICAPLAAQLFVFVRLFERNFFYWRASFSAASSICAPFL